MIFQFFSMLLIITSTSFVFMLFIKLQGKKRVQAKRLPPGPKKLPIIGNLHQLNGNSPHVSLQQLSNDYGPLMFLQLGSVPTLVISSADVVREIFRTHDLVLSGRPQLYVAKKLSYNCNTISFAPYGEFWREMRKIAILELLSSKRVQSFQVVRYEEVALMLEFIARSSAEPVNISRLILMLANNIISRAAFGKKYVSKEDNGRSRFDEMLHQAQDLLGKPNIADFLPWMGWLNMFNGIKARVDKTFGEVEEFCDEEIRLHLDPMRPKMGDLLDVLLQIQKDGGATLTNLHIKAVILDLFVAGTDTSSASLVWAMTELIRNPTVMRKAQNEVREAFKGKEKVEESDVSELIYLKLVIKEALRLHPPAPLLVPRETTEDFVVGEYEIPSGTRVLINAKAIGTDPEHWENPYEFRPERFLNRSVDFKGQNFEMVPFGVGRRGCPGISFATPLIELALSNLLYHFDWKLPPGMKAEDLDMEEAYGITVHKKTPLCLVATPTVF